MKFFDKISYNNYRKIEIILNKTLYIEIILTTLFKKLI